MYRSLQSISIFSNKLEIIMLVQMNFHHWPTATPIMIIVDRAQPTLSMSSDTTYTHNKKKHARDTFTEVPPTEKINGTTKGVCLPISKLRSILAVANLLAHKLWLCYNVQVNSLLLKSSVASKWASKNLWGYHLFCCWVVPLDPPIQYE